MSHTRNKHHHKPKDTPSKISIFVKNEVNIPAQKSQESNINVNNESKDDGCTECFKSLFKSLRS